MGPEPAWSAGDDVGPTAWPQSRGAFERLIDAYQDRLVLCAFRRLGNVHDAEDVVQEVFVRAFADRAKHRHITGVAPYVYRMVLNACTDALRKRGRAAAALQQLGAGENADRRAGPFEASRAAEEIHRANGLLDRLPKAQAEAIRLRVFDELSLNEIAEIAGCPVNTVSSRLRYGFRKLRKIVSKEWKR